MDKTPFKMPLDQAMAGALQAIKEGTAATDAIIIMVNRKTGEFKCAGFPYDPERQFEVLNKALSRFERAARREGRIRDSVLKTNRG